MSSIANVYKSLSPAVAAAVAGAVAGRPSPWPEDAGDADVAGALALLKLQGAAALARHNLLATADWATWPAAIRTEVDLGVAKESVHAEMRRAE